MRAMLFQWRTCLMADNQKKRLQFDFKACTKMIVDPRRLESFSRANIRFGGLTDQRWSELDELAGKPVAIAHGMDRRGTRWIFTRIFKVKENGR